MNSCSGYIWYWLDSNSATPKTLKLNSSILVCYFLTISRIRYSRPRTSTKNVPEVHVWHIVGMVLICRVQRCMLHIDSRLFRSKKWTKFLIFALFRNSLYGGHPHPNFLSVSFCTALKQSHSRAHKFILMDNATDFKTVFCGKVGKTGK